MENITLKEIQSRLLQWETQEKPLAPLTQAQREAIVDLETLINQSAEVESTENVEDSSKNLDDPLLKIDSTYDFLCWYDSLNQNNLKSTDAPFETYNNELNERKTECSFLIEQIDATLNDLNKLSEEYNIVSNKTNELHTMSEQLLADQNKLSQIGDDIKQNLHYFTQVEHLSQRLNSPTMSVNSDTFFNVLAKIDECIEYMQKHANYKESHAYLVKYRHLRNRAISLIRSYFSHVMSQACEQIAPIKYEGSTEEESADMTYAVYFGKFQAAAPKVKRVIEEIEKRAETNEDYAGALLWLQSQYAVHRPPPPRAAPPRDHCSALRNACSRLALACRDEHALYRHYFANTSQPLEDYLQTLCNNLYETLRPHIIHINHLETLAEICVILKVEVLEEQVNNDPLVLSALGIAASALLQDAQERLVFRATVTLRGDVLRYRPAPADLAYPEHLLMMEQIAQSIQDQQTLKRSDSRNSCISDISTTSQEVANINYESQRKPQTSPADLHGMWYPGVRRTLAALSRLYRCLEKRVFQGLAQEAISLCIQSVDNAAKMISTNKTVIDGQLFKIKHLLILREQIAPFQVDFIIKETSLDFSHVKNAAFGLMKKPRQIFSLNSNNALLEFLLEGTPLVREHLLDSRKEVDRQLKSCCEAFIKDASEILVGPIKEFLDKAQAFQPAQELKNQPWATPEKMGAVVTEAQKRIKANLAPLQRSMQLYLANKETEFILFRPIRNNVVGYFVQIEQILTNANFSYEDRLIVACPTPEQVSVFISSASLISHSEPVLPYGLKRKISTVQRPSIAKVEEKQEESISGADNV